MAFLLYLRISLGLLFVATGLAKARDLRQFRQAVESFHIIPATAASRIAPAIVGLELLAGLLLVLGLFEWVGGLLIVGLLLAFTFGLSLNLIHGRRELDCRCFGRPTAGIGWGHVVQNVFLLGIAAVITVLALRDGVGPVSDEVLPNVEGLSFGEAVLPVLGAVYSVLAFLAFQEFMSLRGLLPRLLSNRPRRVESAR